MFLKNSLCCISPFVRAAFFCLFNGKGLLLRYFLHAGFVPPNTPQPLDGEPDYTWYVYLTSIMTRLVMHTFPLTLTLTESPTDSALALQHYLQRHRHAPALIPVLNTDLTFISPHARSTNDFVISRVEPLRDNTFVLYYQIHYFIFNLCQDMNIEDSYATSITFAVKDGELVFDVINNERDTVDEF